MKALTMLATCALAALVFYGCGPNTGNGDGGDNPDGSCAGKADCPNPDGGTITYKVVATAPADVVPQHYSINGAWVENCLQFGLGGCQVYLDPNQGPCTNAGTCEVLLLKPATFDLVPEHDQFLFVEKSVTVSSTVTLANTNWNGVGERGLKVPYGTYTRADANDWMYDELKIQSEVYCKDDQGQESNVCHVLLLGPYAPWWTSHGDLGTKAVLTGYEFDATLYDGSMLHGTFTSDGRTLNYHVVRPDASEFDGAFNRQ